ncbi:MAG: MOSC domain-containing protein [Bradymonadaceae bacterium]
MIRVSQLFVYPIKGCAGVPVEMLEVDESGIRHDRRWMLVDESGQFISQRKVPRLARFVPSVVDEETGKLEVRWGDSGATLSIESPRSGVAEDFKVWSRLTAGVEHAEGSGWFSDILGAPVRLMYSPADTPIAFHDAAQVLVVSEASLDELNRRLAERIPISRFRPNIVLSGASAHEEDRWSALESGEVTWLAAERCGRCVVTTIDQVTGTKTGVEPLKTLATYRSFENDVCFGMYYSLQKAGSIRVKDVAVPG